MRFHAVGRQQQNIRQLVLEGIELWTRRRLVCVRIALIASPRLFLIGSNSTRGHRRGSCGSYGLILVYHRLILIVLRSHLVVLLFHTIVLLSHLTVLLSHLIVLVFHRIVLLFHTIVFLLSHTIALLSRIIVSIVSHHCLIVSS